MFRRSALAAAAVAAALLVPAVAAAQVAPVPSALNEGSTVATDQARMRLSGQVVVTYHGDRRAGCEALARCDIRAGTTTWTAPRAAQLNVQEVRVRGRLRLLPFIYAFGGPDQGVASIASAQRDAPDGIHTCIDARSAAFSALPVGTRGASALTFGLRPGSVGFAGSPSLLARTHCGGPLAADVLAALPQRTVSLAALRRRATTIDLSASAPFAAGGLAGTVVSTVALQLSKARHVRRRPPRRPPRPRPARRTRSIQVEYEIARVAGSMTVDVSGDPRTCAPLDTCGLSGTMTIAPGPIRAGEAYVTASSRRVSDTAALRRAIGLLPGPLPRGVSAYGYANWSGGRGTVTTALARAGAPACRDTAPVRTGALQLRLRRGRVTVSIGSGADGGSDLLVTRCPGPLATDIGSDTPLARQSAPVRSLGARRVTLRLTQGTVATVPGFTLRSHPDLTIELRREKVRAR